MKQITLSKLTLRNFKGIREFVMDTKDNNIRIFGDNGTGKTTLFDAFTFLLFDKDSQNKKDFQVKTLDANGEALHGLEHEVEAVLRIDGRPVTLRKVFQEKWTKKRGSATSNLTGHETNYYIDGVPAKKAEYTSRVDGIMTEDIFKLLTSPTYFNEQLHWQKRREILLEVCGDVSNEDVIVSNDALKKLPDILGDRSIEDHRKVIAAKRAEINRELEKIPVRIDEVQRSMPDVSGLDEMKLRQQISILKSRIEGKDAELSRIQSGGEIAVKEKRLHEIESELLRIKNQLQADTLDKVSAKRQELSKVKDDRINLDRQISDKKWTIDRNSKLIGDSQSEAAKLRQKWHEVNSQTFESHHDTDCPTCGQSLPEEQVQAAHEKALSNFNISKSQQLEEISKKGKLASSEARRLEQDNADLFNEIEILEKQLHAKETEAIDIENELNNLQSSIKNVDDDPQYSSKKQELAEVQQEIDGLKSSVEESTSKVKQEILTMRSQLESLEIDKAKFAQVQLATLRINNLKQQEKELAAEFEKLEQELYLTDLFVRTKVDLLESHINNKFKLARFKLFNTLINGGLEDMCDTTYNGVSYNDLNTAGKIQVGMDIISTLQEHYGSLATIWIDNRESIVKLPEMNCQIISLIVSAEDKKLRLEAV